MSENPMTQMLDMQRTAIEQTHKATRDLVDAQKAFVDAMVDGTQTAQSLGESNAAFGKNAVHAYLDAIEAAMPEDAADFSEVREAFDEQFDAATDAQKDAFESYLESLEEGADLFDEYADNYAETVDDSFDQFLSAYDAAEDSVEEIDVTAA